MGREISLCAEIKVEHDDVLRKCTPGELRHELHRRFEEVPEDLHDEVSRAAPHDVPLIIERYCRPKWTSSFDCQQHYNLEMGR